MEALPEHYFKQMVRKKFRRKRRSSVERKQICESRVEQQRRKSGSNTAKGMKKEVWQRADHASILVVGQAVEPVEKALNSLADRTDKGRKYIT